MNEQDITIAKLDVSTLPTVRDQGAKGSAFGHAIAYGIEYRMHVEQRGRLRPPENRGFPNAKRNHCCPCGSGVKYKKCCIRKVRR